jgi:multimeric flavodoxin WrbA
MSVLVILGSAREDSHTLSLVDAMLQGKPATRIDLRDLDIHHYEYGQPAERDDFIKVADAMTAHTYPKDSKCPSAIRLRIWR